MAFHFVADQQQQQFVYASSYEMITIVGTSHGPLLRTFSWAFLSTFKPQNNFSSLSLLWGNSSLNQPDLTNIFFALAPDDILDRRPHTSHIELKPVFSQYFGSHTFITIHILKGIKESSWATSKIRAKILTAYVCLAFDTNAFLLWELNKY